MNSGSKTPKPPEMPLKQGKTSQHQNWPRYMDCPQIGPKNAKTPKGQMVLISRAHGGGLTEGHHLGEALAARAAFRAETIFWHRVVATCKQREHCQLSRFQPPCHMLPSKSRHIAPCQHCSFAKGQLALSNPVVCSLSDVKKNLHAKGLGLSPFLATPFGGSSKIFQ